MSSLQPFKGKSMTDNKAPAYSWYPRDFAGDEPVQLMSLEEEGAYRRLLDHQWMHGSIPADLPQIAKVCKNVAVSKMRKIWPAISTCFMAVESDASRLQNRKLERVRQENKEYREQRSAAGKLGAKARWADKPDPKPRRARNKKDGKHNSGRDGGATGEAMANRWPASASASASDLPIPKSGMGSQTGGNWPARLAAIFTEHIGQVSPGEMGTHFGEAIKIHGEDLVAAGLVEWAKAAPLTEKPQYLTPKFAARQIALYIAKLKPVQVYDNNGEPTPEFLHATGRAR
jgi:uncharacterized protein YdaU (DUF1376 family)